MKYKDFKMLSVDDMKQIMGGNPPQKKTVCVSCSYMNVSCMSVDITYNCTVVNYSDMVPVPPYGGTIDCQMPGAEEAVAYMCGE